MQIWVHQGKFDAETRERAVRMHLDRLAEHGDAKVGARRHVGELLDVNSLNDPKPGREGRACGRRETFNGSGRS